MFKIFLSIVFTFSILNANDFQEQSVKISNTSNKTATINIGSLKVGQTGIIIHNFSKDKSIILSKAVVVFSNNKSSKISFINEDILRQDSLANTKLTPKDGDIFILNHMYNISLLIAPNFESYKEITTQYDNNFIDSELFAAYLKINETPRPNIEDIKLFTKLNNISTVYIVIKNKLYILDAITFKLLKIKELLINDKTTQVPFYTNIKEIQSSFFNFYSLGTIKDYNKYYLNLIEDK